MPYISLLISDDFPTTGEGRGAITEVSPHDLALSAEEFTRRITLPMTAQLLERISPPNPVH